MISKMLCRFHLEFQIELIFAPPEVTSRSLPRVEDYFPSPGDGNHHDIPPKSKLNHKRAIEKLMDPYDVHNLHSP